MRQTFLCSAMGTWRDDGLSDQHLGSQATSLEDNTDPPFLELEGQFRKHGSDRG